MNYSLSLYLYASLTDFQLPDDHKPCARYFHQFVRGKHQLLGGKIRLVWASRQRGNGERKEMH